MNEKMNSLLHALQHIVSSKSLRIHTMKQLRLSIDSRDNGWNKDTWTADEKLAVQLLDLPQLRASVPVTSPNRSLFESHRSMLAIGNICGVVATQPCQPDFSLSVSCYCASSYPALSMGNLGALIVYTKSQ